MLIFHVKETAVLAALWLLAAGPAAPAARPQPYRPFVSPLFSAHMVFPRDIQAPVWGWTEPGAAITAEMQGTRAEATADADGKWLLRLGPFAAGGPYILTIVGPRDTVTFEDVLIGDVWLCSGQSNMTMGIRDVLNAETEIANADHPQLRLFDMPPWLKEGRRCKWAPCTPETIVDQSYVRKKLPDGSNLRIGFSATAYFFGRDLQPEVNVPIGLVQTSGPGTFIEMWSSSEVLAPLVAGEDAALDAWFADNDAGAADWAEPAFDDSGWPTIDFPLADAVAPPATKAVIRFRKTVELPAEWAGGDVRLSSGWFGNVANTWVNGTFVANLTPDGSCLIPAALLHAGANTIAMRFLNVHGGFGFRTKKADELYLESQTAAGKVSLAGPWRYCVSRPAADFKSAPPPILVRHTDAALGGGQLFESLIRPLAPFAFKGVVWYQGEANQGKRAAAYAPLLTGMIADWRARFEAPQLPFVIVQLANCKGKAPALDTRIPLLREAQAEVARTIPHVSMAVAADIGEEDSQHPKNKQELGRRLALKALEHVYGRHLDASGPVFRGMEPAGAALRLHFDHVGDGLAAGDGPLRGFYVAGADGTFVPAGATIDGPTVVVSSPEVPAPVHVRYGWGSWTPCDLYNAARLPAEPFRTDAWPVTE